jgi:Cu/Ag efflux pump CusA
MPILGLIFSLVGIWGGAYVGINMLGVDEGAYWGNMQASVGFYDDVLKGVIKSLVFGLVVTGVPLEFMGMLGLLSLSGLLIQNGIILVDRMDTEIDEGKPRFDAIVDSAASRVRPVVLGSFTTALGVIPLFFDAFFQSMAVVIVFGLSFATVITLLFVPVLYATFMQVDAKETAL